jgi:hypothetical protein
MNADKTIDRIYKINKIETKTLNKESYESC